MDFSTNASDLPEHDGSEIDFQVVGDEKFSTYCGFVEVTAVQSNYVAVRAVGRGCFQWVFSRAGRVTSIANQWLEQGQTADAHSRPGEAIGIGCNC